MRYCALIGSTSSCTPWFSTQKSPSSIFSSKVNPYWKPEHPPPDTNTRSLRFGFDSSRISSPTLPAAASVKTSTSGGGGAKSPWVIDSDVTLICSFYPVGSWPFKVPDCLWAFSSPYWIEITPPFAHPAGQPPDFPDESASH